MMQTNVRLYSLTYSESRTFLFAALFVIGNMALPQLCHLVPNGGLTLLPIYFFTLIGAYKYGWRVGLLTAILSPIVNHLLFGMPPSAAMPGLLVKSSLLAVIAAYAARRFSNVSVGILLGVVLAYQLVGSLAESALIGSLAKGFQDFRIGIPGMLLQVLGGWAFIKFLLKK
jgi:hypothetical protein